MESSSSSSFSPFEEEGETEKPTKEVRKVDVAIIGAGEFRFFPFLFFFSNLSAILQFKFEILGRLSVVCPLDQSQTNINSSPTLPPSLRGKGEGRLVERKIGWYGLVAARTYLRLRPAANLLIIDSDNTVGGVWSKDRLYPNLVAQVRLGVGKYETEIFLLPFFCNFLWLSFFCFLVFPELHPAPSSLFVPLPRLVA